MVSREVTRYHTLEIGLSNNTYLKSCPRLASAGSVNARLPGENFRVTCARLGFFGMGPEILMRPTMILFVILPLGQLLDPPFVDDSTYIPE
jgi:hypothetical protein